MAKLLFRSAILIAFITGTASAADLPIQPVYSPLIIVPFSWSGFYLGGNIGGHWGQDKITTTTDSTGAFGPNGAAAVDGASAATLNPGGFTGGIQGGYNWQFGSVVVGVEADANWLGGTATRTLSGFPVVAPGDFMTNSTQPTFLLTARPRLGWAFDRILVYVTGGYAFGNVHVNDSFGYAGGTIVGASTVTPHLSGWTAGTGVEWAFADRWSAKLEYLHVDLGSFDNTIPGPVPATNITVHHNYTDNIGRVGLNYRFGS